jgi:hypothetical protein
MVATTHIEGTPRDRSREMTAAANGAAPAKPNRAFSGRSLASEQIPNLRALRPRG